MSRLTREDVGDGNGIVSRKTKHCFESKKISEEGRATKRKKQSRDEESGEKRKKRDKEKSLRAGKVCG